jgi:hypothetical protein
MMSWAAKLEWDQQQISEERGRAQKAVGVSPLEMCCSWVS